MTYRINLSTLSSLTESSWKPAMAYARQCDDELPVIVSSTRSQPPRSLPRSRRALVFVLFLILGTGCYGILDATLLSLPEANTHNGNPVNLQVVKTDAGTEPMDNGSGGNMTQARAERETTADQAYLNATLRTGSNETQVDVAAGLQYETSNEDQVDQAASLESENQVDQAASVEYDISTAGQVDQAASLEDDNSTVGQVDQAASLEYDTTLNDSNGAKTSSPNQAPAVPDFSDYECVSWRQTSGCSPDGKREPESDRPCDERIGTGMSGYCEIQHRTTGERRRVMPMHCRSIRDEISFQCSSFADFLTYGAKALVYTHDRAFQYSTNQADLLRQNTMTSPPPDEAFFQRGIVMVVYDELVLSVFAGIRWLRQQGSSLPIEMWYRPEETDPHHPLLQSLIANHNVFLREITDRRATGFYTKLHAVFYSAFDNVLLLDADNFAVNDPSYLFDTIEFQTTGAIFWPDFWKPDNTLFNVHNESLVWQVFDLPFVNMFEQESGQVLIDRRRHMKALNALMYYGFTLPRIHEEMRLVWGDKDLFRFAWMKTDSTFEMIPHPPGTAGKQDPVTGAFCGLTMVQYDPPGEILFLHRNAQKLRADKRQSIWTHVQQFKHDAPLREYRIGWAKVFDTFPSCWGKSTDWDKYYRLSTMPSLGFGSLEETLLRLADEGVAMVNAGARR